MRVFYHKDRGRINAFMLTKSTRALRPVFAMNGLCFGLSYVLEGAHKHVHAHQVYAYASTSVRDERFMLYGIVVVLGDGGRK